MKKCEKEKLTLTYYTLWFVIRSIVTCDVFKNIIKTNKFLSKLINLMHYIENNYKDGILNLNENQKTKLHDAIEKFKDFANGYDDKSLFIKSYFDAVSDVVDGQLKSLCYLYNTFNEDELYKIML